VAWFIFCSGKLFFLTITIPDPDFLLLNCQLGDTLKKGKTQELAHQSCILSLSEYTQNQHQSLE